MASQENQGPAAKSGPGPLQFGLGALFVLTTFTAVTCSIFFRMPYVYATPALAALSVALPAVLTTFLVYSRGYGRAFCIGALFPAAAMLFCSSVVLMIHLISAYQNNVAVWLEFADKVGPYYRPCVGAAWGSCVVLGLLSMLIRWFSGR